MRCFAFLAPLLLLAVDSTADTLYRCKDAKGGVIFSDEPCGPSAETIELNIHRPSAEERLEAQRRADHAIAITDELMRERNRQRALAREAEIRFYQERQRERAEKAARAKRERERAESTRPIIIIHPPPRRRMGRRPHIEEREERRFSRPRHPPPARDFKPSR